MFEASGQPLTPSAAGLWSTHPPHSRTHVGTISVCSRLLVTGTCSSQIITCQCNQMCQRTQERLTTNRSNIDKKQDKAHRLTNRRRVKTSRCVILTGCGRVCQKGTASGWVAREGGVRDRAGQRSVVPRPRWYPGPRRRGVLKRR